jgi:hypothetical protein
VDLDAARRCTTERKQFPAVEVGEALSGDPAKEDDSDSLSPCCNCSKISTPSSVAPSDAFVEQFKTINFNMLPAAPRSVKGLPASPPLLVNEESFSFSLNSCSVSKSNTMHR